MEILKQGNKNQNRLANKVWKKKCDKCGCKFKFNFDDTHLELSVIDVMNYYVNCPQCGKTHFVTTKL